MSMVSFKIGALADLNTTNLPIREGQFIVAKSEAENRAEIYVDNNSKRLRVGDFESYASLAALNAAYADPETRPSISKLYYIQGGNVLAVWDPHAGAQGTGAFVQINDCGITDIDVTGTGDYISGASLSQDGRKLTLTKGSLTADKVEYKAETSAGAGDAVSVKDALDELTGSGAGSVDSKISTAIDALDVTEFAVAEKDSTTNVITIHGISETNGKVASGTTNNLSLAAVAATGAAANVSITDTGSHFTATDVEGALAELAVAAGGGVASKTVYITETAGGSGAAYSKRYGIYQGSEGSAASPVVGEKLADIDIPKDMVVEAGEVVDVVFDDSDDSLHEGSISGTDVTEEIKGTGGTATAADAGKYIKLTIANSSGDHLWIAAKDLVDIYTAAQSATQVQLAISATNEISATLVAGGVGATELASNAVVTAKIADEAVTEGKLAQAVQDKLNASVGVTAVAEGTTNGTVSVTTNGTTADVAVHGLGSAAYAATTAFDAAGTASTAIAALDADLDASGTAQYSGTFVVSGVTEVDGVLTAVDSVEVEAAGAAATAKSQVIGTSSDTSSTLTLYGVKAYAAEQATAALTWGTFQAPANNGGEGE